jgi:hypothetical protein
MTSRKSDNEEKMTFCRLVVYVILNSQEARTTSINLKKPEKIHVIRKIVLGYSRRRRSTLNHTSTKYEYLVDNFMFVRVLVPGCWWYCIRLLVLVRGGTTYCGTHAFCKVFHVCSSPLMFFRPPATASNPSTGSGTIPGTSTYLVL